MIAGFERPTAGTIRRRRADITDLPPNQRKVGMVFQAYALFPNMTVGAERRLRPEGRASRRAESRAPASRRC